MPGYEPFLLCDFHTHTTWSDGRLTIRELIDLYGQTGQFDVIAITDHILRKNDVLAKAARVATFGRRRYSLVESDRPKHLYSWKTLVRSRKDWPSIKTALRENMNLAITLYRGESWTDSRRPSRADIQPCAG